MTTPGAVVPWTSRRRLLTALSGGTPDRVPVNTYELAGRNSLDWYNRQPSYQELMEYVRAHTDCITNWNPRPLTDRNPGLDRFLCSDFPVEIQAQTDRIGQFLRTTRLCHTPRGVLSSVAQSREDVNTTWRVEHWCKSVAEVDMALEVPYQPANYDFSDLPRVRWELGEAGIVLTSLRDPAYVAADLMSFQDFLMWAFEETDHFARTVKLIADRVMENLRRQLDGWVADCYRIVGPEYFTPPYLPPSMFERFVFPHVAAMTELIHSRGGRVRVHCHGKIGRVLDMILATGCDGIDPCEPPPDGDLELAEVKRRCQVRGVSVWGNIELRALEQGSPAEIRALVADAMRQAKEGGGFILMPTAAPISVPPSAVTELNYRAFIDAGREFGGY
jgi:uroporphyrinogen-III decarboxylase